ncbi:putative sulfoacetate transporter SauU [Gimesia panareensis]|uniref:Putative sulfoacetate transporter SauU n=1 Tax=Gimesia panareensis TaxID=2527978 RepID=A0A518FKM7_9PLAN|nr:MFS transporter [Gimesia panareensis]QDV16867.1 putative sulfoacetate transporter SauU [Gimesia panareensis]
MTDQDELKLNSYEPPTRARYLVLTLLCLVAAVAYISRNAISVPAKLIQEELDITQTQMGWVMSAFFWSYALSQIPSGWLAHVWGTRRSLTAFAILWSIATALTGMVTGFWMLIGVRLIFGISQAGIFPCCASTISKWLPHARRGLASGLLGSFMSIGSAFGAFSIGVLLAGIHTADIDIPGLSWRTIMYLCAVPGIVWVIVFYFWFRDRPEEHRGVNSAELEIIRGDEVKEPAEQSKVQEAEVHAESTPWEQILTSFSMWMICGQQFFRAAGNIFYMTWFPVYLQKARNISVASSGIWTSLPLLTFVVGNFLGGVVVDWVLQRTGSRRWSRQGVAIVAMLGCGLCTLCAYFVQEMKLAMTLISVSMFFAGLGGACGYTVTIDKGGQHVAPIFGMMNMMGNLGAALLPVVVGVMFDAGLYGTVLILMAGIYASAALCWMLLNPNGTVFDDKRGTQQA